jgi:hypothetical protein
MTDNHDEGRRVRIIRPTKLDRLIDDVDAITRKVAHPDFDELEPQPVKSVLEKLKVIRNIFDDARSAGTADRP